MSQSNAQILFQPEVLSAHLDNLQNADHSGITGTPSSFQLKLKESKSPLGMPPHKGSYPKSSPNPSRRASTIGHSANAHSSAYDAHLARTYGTPIDGPATAEPGADPSTTHKEQILSYIYSWVEWASRIKDPGRRAQVMTFVKEALEGALKHGIEIRAFKPEDVHGIKKGVSGKVEIEISVKASAEVVEQGKTVNAVPPAEDLVVVQKALLKSTNGTKRDAADAGVEQGKAMKAVPSAERRDATQEATTRGTNGPKRDAADAGLEQSGGNPASKKQKTDVKKDMPDASQVVKAGDPEQKAMKEHAQQKPTRGDVPQTQEPVGNAGDGQKQTASQEQATQGSKATSPEGAESSDDEELSQEEKAKRDRYLQQIFRPRFNIVMKMAGQALARGKCSDWHTCRTRLEKADVDLRRRNMFMRDFVDGYKKWNEAANGDPNLEIAEYLKRRHAKLHQRAVEEREAAIGSSEKKSPQVTPAQLVS